MLTTFSHIRGLGCRCPVAASRIKVNIRFQRHEARDALHAPMADVHVTMSGRILPARRLHRVHSHIADFSQALPTELCVTVSGGNMSNTMQCNRRNTVCHLLALSNTPMTALNINTSAETRLSPESLACTIARRHDLLMCLSPNSHVHKYTDTRVHTHT